jgi:hypothetical protein
MDMGDDDKTPEVIDDEVSSHVLPLKLLAVGEEYTVHDVLGVTTGHPNIDHIRVPHSNGYGEMTMLHSTSRNDSFAKTKSGNSLSSGLGSRPNLNKDAGKKKVGFEPEPPSYHAMHGQPGRSFAEKEQIALESTDGLIVASVFLPVHLHRSAEGEWSADWDYESLLSMQTHLRVTRIGVVKWRGWHGNVGKDGSPEGGVPVDERHKVEACLRTLNCVPVWVEPVLLGEMYVHYELYFQPLFSVLQKSHTPSAVHEFVGTMDFVKEYCGQFFTT